MSRLPVDWRVVRNRVIHWIQSKFLYQFEILFFGEELEYGGIETIWLSGKCAFDVRGGSSRDGTGARWRWAWWPGGRWTRRRWSGRWWIWWPWGFSATPNGYPQTATG